MSEYIVETHVLGTYVNRKSVVYHLVKGKVHEYTSKSLEAIYNYCRNSETPIHEENMTLLLSDEDKRKWNKIKDIYSEYYKRIRRLI